MTSGWQELIDGERWRSLAPLWVEDGTEYGAAEVSAVAAAVADAIRGHAGVRVVRVRAASKLGCFAGQLGAWRAGCVAVADPGTLGPAELDHVRPELTVDVAPDREPEVQRADVRLSPDRIPAEVVAVNFTSGSTGTPKAVAVTRANLLALFGCRGLDVPAAGRLAAGSFATAAFDGWWFDTWRTVAAGGTVVCLPGVNEDVFAWPELAAAYGIDRVLLPAAVVAAVIDAVPGCLAGIPWVFSGGEQFQVATYRKARAAGLTARFVNLYGPTEATFATHRYGLPETLGGAAIPIGTALDGCEQTLSDRGGGSARELVVSGPLVCLGYLARGALATRFGGSYPTGDLVRVDEDGNLVFAGRLDSRIKVNGIRVDAAALERRVTGLPAVSDCRVVQDDRHTVAFVRADDLSVQQQVESVVRGVSPAIRVQLVDRFPMKSGGKVDTATLMDRHGRTDKGGEQ